MKFGIILSAGGASFFAAYDLLLQANKISSSDVLIITDRECGAEKAAYSRGIALHRVSFSSRRDFSAKVAKLFKQSNIDIGIMLHSKLVSIELFGALPLLNIHPAILPAFKGMDAVGQALTAQTPFIGATIHLTTDKIDDGDMVGQVVSPISRGISRELANKISFLQKTYLVTMVIDVLNQRYLSLRLDDGLVLMQWNRDVAFSCSANPLIQSTDVRILFDQLQLKNGLGGIIQ